jgi:hypothetical protein
MYEKPVLQRFGTFRELTQWGFANASDGGSIFVISGCSTTVRGVTFNIGCPAPTPGPTTS